MECKRGQALGLGISGHGQEVCPSPYPLLPLRLLGPGPRPGGCLGGAPQGRNGMLQLFCGEPFPCQARGHALRAPVRVAQIPGQWFCASLCSPAGLSRGPGAWDSCREPGASRRIKLSRKEAGCARH